MIIRNPNRNRYVNISKVPLEDSRLSWKARGLHAFLMSKPDNWDVVVEYLVGQSEKDGRDSVRGALKELETAGYIARTKTKNNQGKYDGTDCEIFEEPYISPDQTGDGFSNDGKPGPGIPEDGESHTNDYLDIESNEKVNATPLSQPKKVYPPVVYELNNHLCQLIEYNGSRVPSGGESDMDKLIRLDKRDPAEIRAVIDWCQSDSFWRANILSALKLRKQYDTLRLQMKAKGVYLPESFSPETLALAWAWDAFDSQPGPGTILQPDFPRPQDSNGNFLDGEGRAWYRDPMQPTKRRYVDDE